MTPQAVQYIRWLLWLYVILLIIEGALRRWFLPGLAGPLLIVRDPVALAAVFLGARYLLGNVWVVAFVFIGALGSLFALVAGHGNPAVALYGARIYVLHLPLIFLFPAVFGAEDFWKFCRFFLLIAIPMTVLIAVQHFVPQTHWVNIGLGGVESAGFGGAMGRYRPPGTFSFITGVAMFYPLCASLLLAMWLKWPGSLPKWIWISAACIIIAVPLSISRSVMFAYMAVITFTMLLVFVSPGSIRRLVPSLLALFLVFAVVSQTALFEDAYVVFDARWQGANLSEGGDWGMIGALEHRTLRYFVRNMSEGFDAPLFGFGIGSGTSAGAQMLRGARALAYGEGEWGIIMFELGPLLGLFAITIRLALASKVGLAALRTCRAGNLAGLPLAAMPCIYLVMAITGQPTSLGFMVISIGLVILSFKLPLTQPKRLAPQAQT